MVSLNLSRNFVRTLHRYNEKPKPRLFPCVLPTTGLPVTPSSNKVHYLDAVIFLKLYCVPIWPPHNLLVQFNRNSFWCKVEMIDEAVQGKVKRNLALFAINLNMQ